MINPDVNSYLSQREARLQDTMNEYIDGEDFEALAAAIISHLQADYRYHSERCGKLKRVLELLQTGNIQ